MLRNVGGRTLFFDTVIFLIFVVYNRLLSQDRLLDPEKSLMDADITEDGELRLEVKGDDGGSLFSGPPISLRVRVGSTGSDGNPRTFTVETTQVRTRKPDLV